MSNENEYQPPEPPSNAAPDSQPATPPPTGPTAGHLFRLRSVIAVAAAGVILGVLGGQAVTHLVDGHARDDHGLMGGPPGDGPGFPRRRAGSHRARPPQDRDDLPGSGSSDSSGGTAG